MEETLQQVGAILTEIVTNLTNPDAWKTILEKPEVQWAAFIAVTLIVFTETGLLFGFFLPGDSLLVTVGIVGYGAGWPIHILIPMLCVAAILGDSTGYLIGYKAGPRLFHKEKSFFFRKDYLLMAQEFYQRHGGKTIIFAKYVPIIRTFAPVVAGIGRMGYRRFIPYSAAGAVSWIISMVLLGYTAHYWLEPLVNTVAGWFGFAPNFRVEKQIDKIIIVVVLISIVPLALKGAKQWRARRRARLLAPAPTPSPTSR